jgi:hypothetical protein
VLDDPQAFRFRAHVVSYADDFVTLQPRTTRQRRPSADLLPASHARPRKSNLTKAMRDGKLPSVSRPAGPAAVDVAEKSEPDFEHIPKKDRQKLFAKGLALLIEENRSGGNNG